MADLPKLYDMGEIANMLKASRRWVYYHLQGRGIGRIVGRKRLFTEADAKQIVDELPRAEAVKVGPPARGTTKLRPQMGASDATARLLNRRQPKSDVEEALRLVSEKPAARRRNGPTAIDLLKEKMRADREARAKPSGGERKP